MTTPPEEAAGYERRIRIASELATWGIAFVLVASAALPTTNEASRRGLRFSAFLLAGFTLLWFHFIPPSVFGSRRFTIGTAITQLIGAALLVLTGGADSEYFIFFFLPTLATTFAMRLSSTLVTATIALARTSPIGVDSPAPDRALRVGRPPLDSCLFMDVVLITKPMLTPRCTAAATTDWRRRTSSSTSRARHAALAPRAPRRDRSCGLDVARRRSPSTRFFFTPRRLMDPATQSRSTAHQRIEADHCSATRAPGRCGGRTARNDAAVERSLAEEMRPYVCLSAYIPLIIGRPRWSHRLRRRAPRLDQPSCASARSRRIAAPSLAAVLRSRK